MERSAPFAHVDLRLQLQLFSGTKAAKTQIPYTMKANGRFIFMNEIEAHRHSLSLFICSNVPTVFLKLKFTFCIGLAKQANHCTWFSERVSKTFSSFFKQQKITHCHLSKQITV